MMEHKGAWRSSKFKVKDIQKFKDVLFVMGDTCELLVAGVDYPETTETAGTIYLVGTDYASWPEESSDDTSEYLLEDPEYGFADIDYNSLFGDHLQPGQIVVLTTGGYTVDSPYGHPSKLTAVWGYAVAYNWDGEMIELATSNIHAMAKKKWKL